MRHKYSKKSRKEMEKNLIGIIDERNSQLKNEISRESALRFENIEYIKSCMEVI